MFQAIEQNADNATKAKAGFQWQNPNVEKIHESEDALLIAHLIREYFDHYRMDYSKSVYVPEVSLEQAKDLSISMSKIDLMTRAGINNEAHKDECVLVQMSKQI